MKNIVDTTADRLIRDCNPDHFEHSERFTKYIKDKIIGNFGKWMFANGYNAGVSDLKSKLRKKIISCGECAYSHMTVDGEYCKYCDQITDDEGNHVELYYPKYFYCANASK